MPYCFGIWETTGVNKPSWHAATKIRQDFFFSDPTEKPDQRYDIQLWLYKIDSFCYPLFIVCLLCTIHSLTQEYNNEEGMVLSFDVYKSRATNLRCAKPVSFHTPITIYVLFEAPTHTVTEIRDPLTPFFLGCL